MGGAGGPKPRTDWGAASFVLALCLAFLAAVQAYYTFNSTVTRDVAVLQSQVNDLRDRVREMERGHGGARP